MRGVLFLATVVLACESASPKTAKPKTTVSSEVPQQVASAGGATDSYPKSLIEKRVEQLRHPKLPEKMTDARMQDPKEALAYLLGSEVWHGGGDGEDEPIIPPGETAMETLVKASDVGGLRRVLGEGTPEAQVYAFWGLRRLGKLRTAEEQALEKLRKNGVKLRWKSYGIPEELTVDEILEGPSWKRLGDRVRGSGIKP